MPQELQSVFFGTVCEDSFESRREALCCLEQLLRLGLVYCGPMRMNDMTVKQLTSVPCPRCGAEAGKGCLEPSGTLRALPHVDRRLNAISAVEVKRSRVVDSAKQHDIGAMSRRF